MTSTSNIAGTIEPDQIALKIVRWELYDSDNTTMRSATPREPYLQPMNGECRQSFKGSGVDLAGILALMTGGVYYLSSQKSRFRTMEQFKHGGGQGNDRS